MMIHNRALEEWPDLFNDPLLASAGLDRLTHRAEMVIITGASYRAHGPRGLQKEAPIAAIATS